MVRAEDGRIVDESAFEDLLALDNFSDPKMSARRSLCYPGWSLATDDAAAAVPSSGAAAAAAAAAVAGVDDEAFNGLVIFLKVALDKLQFAKQIKELQKTSGLGDDTFSEGRLLLKSRKRIRRRKKESRTNNKHNEGFKNHIFFVFIFS